MREFLVSAPAESRSSRSWRRGRTDRTNGHNERTKARPALSRKGKAPPGMHSTKSRKELTALHIRLPKPWPRDSRSELKWSSCPVPQSPVQVIPAAAGGSRTPEPQESSMRGEVRLAGCSSAISLGPAPRLLRPPTGSVLCHCHCTAWSASIRPAASLLFLWTTGQLSHPRDGYPALPAQSFELGCNYMLQVQ